MFCPMRPTMSPLDTAPANGGSNRLHHRPGKSGITAFHVRRDKAALFQWVQAPKRTMCRPTRTWNRGRLTRMGEMSEDYAQPLHRGSGGSMYTRKAHATREAPLRDQG